MNGSEPWNQDRIEQIQDLLDGVVDEGECYLVRCHNGEIEAAAMSKEGIVPLRLTHEELYGCMLSINEDISAAGSHLMSVMFFAAVAFCVGIHLQWFAELSPFLAKFNSLWFFLPFLALVIYVGKTISWIVGDRVYSFRRNELLQAIFESGLSRYQLLSRMEGDPSLADLATVLKKDKRGGKLS